MKRCASSPLRRAAAGLLAAALAAPALAAGPRAYIPLGSADRVAVIDIETQRVTGEARGVVNTHGADLTPDGRFLVAGSLTAREAGSVPSRPEGVSEDEHAAHHGGGAAPAADRSGVLYLIDTGSLEPVRRFDVPGPVHHVLVTRDGRYAVATHPMGGGVSVLELETGELVADIKTGPAPNYLVQGPEGQALYVSNSGNGTVSEIDTGDWFVRRNLRLGGSPEHMVLGQDDGLLYVNDVEAGSAAALNLGSGDVVARYAIGPKPHGVDLSPDGRTLYVTSEEGGHLVAVSLPDGATRTAELAPAPYHLAVSPADGRLLVSSRDLPKLWVVDPRTLAAVGEIPLAGVGHQAALQAAAPD